MPFIQRYYPVLLSLLLAGSAMGQTVKQPYRLRCELLLHTGLVQSKGMAVNKKLEQAVQQKNTCQFATIVNQQPVLHWELDTSVRSTTAYRVLVASSLALLSKNQGDYWDSKKTGSTHSFVKYGGKLLAPGKVYYWKVQVWDHQNRASAFSAHASFYHNVPDSGDLFSHYPLSAELQKPSRIVKNAQGSYFLDFGKDAFSQLQLHLTSEKTDSIWIEAAEAVESPYHILKTNGNIRYIRRAVLVEKGTHDYTIVWPANSKRNSRNPIQMPAYIGEVFPFRYVSIENFAGTINKASVQRKVVSYPFDNSSSSFISSDSILNQGWELCRYSVKATSFTGYYVDGDRERLPYEADALINQLSHYSVDAEYSMARRSMAFLLFHPTWPTEWSLQNVFLAWNDYLYTGDDSFISLYYTELQKKILMPLAGANGLISTTAGKQTDSFLVSIHMVKDFDGKHGLKDNVDWPQRGDYIGNEKQYAGETDGFVYTRYNAVVNAWYYRCLVLMQKIALLLNKPADAHLYEVKAKQVYQSFQEVFREAGSGLMKDGDTTSHTSLHANMFALAFGLVPDTDKAKVIQFIKTRRMACSVYGAQFLLDALYDNDEGGYALKLLTATTQRSWYNMIRTGSTITMEAWDKLYKPNLDLNHAWGSAPANIIVRKLMGVEPLTPGGETLQIKPQLGDLRFASLTTRTVKGLVRVSYKKNKVKDTLELTIPGGTHANIYLAVNAERPGLWVDGKKVHADKQNGYFVITAVQAGKHVVVME